MRKARGEPRQVRHERADPITGATGEHSGKHFIRHLVKDGLEEREGRREGEKGLEMKGKEGI